MSEQFDVIVVGGGTAGAAAANRLSEDANRTVLMLEAGPDFPDEITNPPSFLTGGNSLGHNFAGIGAPTPDTDWDYWGEPLADGRRLHHRRGKMVGGSSMVNGTIAVRASPADFDRWREHGAVSWSWEDVEPYIELVETMTPIRQVAPEHWSPVAQMFAESFKEIGYRWVENMNAPDAWNGVVGQWPLNRKNAVRQGTLVTYVREARDRPNLEIRGYSLADRVLIRDGRAEGVRYVDSAGEWHEVRAGSVLLTGGAYGSPSVLLRSGIGPEEQLRSIGIEPHVTLPVGRNMLEHPQCFFYAKGAPELADMTLPGWPVVARARDNSWWCFPLALDEDTGLCAYSFALADDTGEGSITLTSADPSASPRIDHRMQDVIDSNRFDHAHATFQELIATHGVTSRNATDPEAGRPLREILQERMGTAFHPAGGCQIGRVVDDDLSVYGIEGLRVADASVFPIHIFNNPNLTCMMLGERVADFIKGAT